VQRSTDILLEKLEVFIRKFYKNQLIKGLIYVVAGVVTAFLITSLLEYFGHFHRVIRTVLFFSFALFSGFILIKYIVLPLLKLNKMGTRINYNQAAGIIGLHFPEIGDKLTNTLELEKRGETDSNELLKAAIEQKTQKLTPVPFHQAIDLNGNKRYIKYAVIPVLALFAIILVAPGFTESSKRLVQYNTHFEEKAPFDFILDMDEKDVLQNEDLEIKLITKGNTLPAEAYIELDGHRYKMKGTEKGSFVHPIKKVRNTLNFRFTAEGFGSAQYEIKVLPKPTLLEYTAFLSYPSYTGIKNEERKNTSDITVPTGTQIKWKLSARNTDEVVIVSKGKLEKSQRNGNVFQFMKRFLTSENISIRSKNKEVAKGDSVSCAIRVVPDQYPSITAEEKPDSMRAKLVYMMGKIADDYGFKKLVFRYTFISSKNKDKVGKTKEVPINISTTGKDQRFYHFWDLNLVNVEPDDKLEYYFEVWDNDGVYGSKSARTSTKIYEAPSLAKINADTEKKTEEIKSEIAQSKKELSNMQKDILELEKKLTEKKNLNWEEKKKIQELLDKHKNFEKQLENIVEENKKKNVQENEFKQIDQEIKQKQDDIEKLFEEVMSEEMKDIMRQIQELMEQNQKDKMMQKLDQMKVSDKEVQKQLDRMLEQLKQLQLEKKVDETIEKLNELAKEQKELSDESKKGEKEKEELSKEQEKLNKKFDEVKKDLKDIDKKNKDLEKPLDLEMEKQEEQKNKVDQEQKESQENLQKNKKSKAAENQQKAAEEMQDMAKKMQQQMQDAQAKQQTEDMNTLREILDNLIQISKDQEALMQEFKSVRGYSPKYVDLGQQQKKIRDDARMIEDSLLALSKRVKQVEHFINKEIGLVNSNLEKAMNQVGERNINMVAMHQQYVMTSMNNLALMLSESLKQMQEQMKSKPGSGTCKNPGKNPKPGSAKSMRELQESLKKKLDGMSEEMKSGGKPGSKEFAEAAAMQAAIRKKMRDLKNQLDKEGKGGSLGDLKKTEEMMDELEEKLYNKQLDPNVINRQQDILSRLLEHEKAEQKQEMDDKRKSNEGSESDRIIPPSIQEYLKQKEKEQELLKTLPPELTPYYKNKVRDYFKELDS
jgi:hypothetical protein